MMTEFLQSLISLSFVSGLALFFCPEGGAKRLMKVLCTAVLTAVIISPLREFDYDVFNLAEARLSSAEAEIISGAKKSETSLKAVLFTQNCEEYIKAKGQELGLKNLDTSVEIRQTGEEEWLPWSVTIRASGVEESAEALCRIIRDDLGIAAERQVWNLNEQK